MPSRVVRVLIAVFIGVTSMVMIAPAPAQAQTQLPNIPAAAPDGDGTISDGQIGDAFTGSTGIIGQGARAALTVALNRLGLWTTPRIAADDGNANWFTVHYRLMRVMGLWVLMPLVMISIIHSIFKSSMSQLLRTVLVFLPISILGAAVAVDIVQLALDITDDISNVFAQAIIVDSTAFFSSVSEGLGIVDELTGGGVPLFFDLLMIILLLLVTIGVYVIMLVREGSIYLATAFLPIGFAMMVWPSTSRFFRRMVEFLFAIIFSKVVMLACISLAIASLAGSAGGAQSTAGTAGLAVNGSEIGVAGVSAGETELSAGQWISDIAAAVALMVVVILAPQMTVRLVSNLGIGEMAANASMSLARPTSLNNVLFFDRLVNTSRNATSLVAGGAGKRQSYQRNQRASLQEQMLESSGVHRNQRGNYEMNDAILAAHNVDAAYWGDLKRMTSNANNNPNDIAAAYAAVHGYGADFDGFEKTSAGWLVKSKTGESSIILDITNKAGRVIRNHHAAPVRRAIADEAERQITESGSVRGINVIAPHRTKTTGGADIRPRGYTNWEDSDRRTVSKAVWEARRGYTAEDGGAPPIRLITAPTASKWSRVNRPLDPAHADAAGGSYAV